MSWKLKGEYFENCSCDVLCPCVTSALQAPADAERCQVPFFFRIDEGEADGVQLGGLTAAVVADSPPRMADGNWRVGVYVDEAASPEQRDALVGILSGANGGPMAMLSPLVGEVLGVKTAKVRYSGEGASRRGEIEGIAEFEVESIVLVESGDPVTIANVVHPMGSDLPVARSSVGRYSDPEWGLSFDNTGKNGHIREFDWAG